MSPDAPVSEKPAAAKKEATPEENGYANREAFLTLVGDMNERTLALVNTDGRELKLLLQELTGKQRAELITLQAKAYQKGELDLVNYEKRMMAEGIADPNSPRGARQPLLRPSDADSLMKLGASKVQQIVAEIEDLSGMGMNAQARAEGNSVTIPSGDSTSA